MRSIHVAVFALMAVVLSVAAVVATQPATAQTPLQVDIAEAEANAVDAIYRDFLSRPATRDEIDRFVPRLGVGQTENDVRIRVLGSRSFFFEVAGATREGFVNAVYRELLGRAPTANELTRDKLALFRAKGSLVDRRRNFAEGMLERANYDPDELGVREIVLHTNAAGDIVRFAFELDENFDRDDDISITVSIKAQPQAGVMRVRAFENIVSLVPDVPVPIDGKIVGMVFIDDGTGVRIADLSTPSRNLPDRTTDEVSPWPERVFEDQRVIAYYGNHLTPLLGVLGETGPEAAVGRVNAAAAPFNAPDKRAVGAFEMIVTVAQRSAGADGNYSHPSNLQDVERWIDIAEANGLYVILDIQPGRSDFLTESIRYEELLKRPNVGLALDPEWRMGPNEIPGRTVGSVTAAEVNEVSEWLSNLVLENDLPEKIFMVHQFQVRMIQNREDLIDRPGLATVIHADGFGGREIKLVTYGLLQVEAPLYNGFKLFIDEDTRIFQPADVLGFTTHPVPDFVSYQ